MLKITLKNGNLETWNPDDYTDYMYDGKSFIIIKGQQWVGIYNLDCVNNIVFK